ncbi:hypothetical protein ACLQ9J_18735 [Bordetella hinzii]|uniref:hypothetical protein n=1 Tax=Bordetella hinzii TaxID=103855 RepID=UPI0039FC48EC
MQDFMGAYRPYLCVAPTMGRKMKAVKVFFAFLVVVAISGCAGFRPPVSFTTDVNSFASDEADSRKHYFLTPVGKGVSADDLEFKEYARYVDKILDGKGYVKEPDLKNAEIIIRMEYGISGPKTQKSTYSIPIVNQTGVLESKTTGKVNAAGKYTETTTYTPRYEVTGYSTGVNIRTIFTSWVSLQAVEAKVAKNKKEQVFWQIQASSTDENDDLRLVFPYMVAAMEPYMAVNTGKRVSVTLNEKDPRLTFLTGQPVQQKKQQ